MPAILPRPSANGAELTVVIPARNEERFLPQQLDALAAQDTHINWDVVVVDNGSSDKTADVARSFADRIPQLRVVAEPRPGLCQARDAGVAASSADHIVFCDADDVVAPGWVAAMATSLRKHSIATGPLDVERLNTGALSQMRGIRGDKRMPTFFGVFPYARGNNFGVHRELYDSMGGFDARYTGGEDIEFSMRAWWENVEIGFADNALVHYRYRETPRQLWRQGFGYGVVRPALRNALISHGSPAPSAFAGWRSWVWLVRILPTIRTEFGRCNVAWVAGNRFGQLAGSWATRRVFL